jgi:RimK family alpha-L-glutamate ligase
MKIGLITQRLTWENKKIIEAFGGNHKVYLVDPSKVILQIGNKLKLSYKNIDLNAIDIYFNRLDIPQNLVLHRYCIEVVRFIAKENRVINQPSAVELAHNKWGTTWVLNQKGIPTPKMALLHSELSFDQIIEDFDLPFVIKPPFGSWGKYVEKITNKSMFRAIFEKIKSHSWFAHTGLVVQEYLPHKRDIRCFVIGDKTAGIMYRVAKKGCWKTNISLGGRVEKCELTDEIDNLAVSSVKAIGGEIMAVDIVECDSEFKVLEVNGVPNFRGLSKLVPGIPKEIANYILNSK